ncbi:AmpE protein [Tamilnaduibacter salinus]|uniref:AmpE protein n=1 Tax=Tamilnaduibacter salinus TaxID=1484056 RepID=A0A2A2I265_9GAMM|nr:histidine kinase [Tamilnaduibacter salinus]PAV25093.1 histidine kinase [Tamilnaduibacter salinus]PVY69584.1 AmpE protein [Tamilnaduibacter salinus]
MTFFAILLGYLIRRGLDASGRVGSDAVFRLWFSRMPPSRAGREHRAWPGVAILLGAVLLAVLIGFAFRYWHLSFLQWFFDALMIALLLGRPGWKQALTGYGQAWRRGDAAQAWREVQALLPASVRGDALEPRVMHLALCRQYLVQTFEHYFMLLFWFAVLGLPGLILSRLALALRDHWPHPGGRAVFERPVTLLAWIPARVLALSFGIAGDLAGWMSDRRQNLFRFGGQVEDLLFDSANGALSSYSLDPDGYQRVHPDGWPDYGARSLQAVRDLLNRSLLVWISAFAILAILGIL